MSNWLFFYCRYNKVWSPIWMAYISPGELYWFWYCLLWSCQNQILYMSQLDCVFTHCGFWFLTPDTHTNMEHLFGYCKMLCMSCVRYNFVILLPKKKFVFRFVLLFPVCSALAGVCFLFFCDMHDHTQIITHTNPHTCTRSLSNIQGVASWQPRLTWLRSQIHSPISSSASSSSSNKLGFTGMAA